MDIDLVYLWVNGNDPKWMARRDAFIGKPTGKQENCVARYADSGELKYSLRSVEKNAPWIRKIFIVTDDQVPKWLDTSNPRVQIIDHKDIMPAESLPCYNSTILEHYLHKIPGLSEHFIYSNDDMYINKPVSPDTFFASDGMPIIYMTRKPFRKQILSAVRFLRCKIMKKPMNLYVQIIHNAALMVEKKYGKYYGCKAHHNMDSYVKSTFDLVHQMFSAEMLSMHPHHMRSMDDFQRSIYSYVALAEHRGHLRYVSNTHSFRLHVHKKKYYRQFEKYQPVFFCINDTEHATDADRKFSIEYLDRLFPKKSQFEK